MIVSAMTRVHPLSYQTIIMTFNSIIIINNYFNYHYVRRRRTHTNRVVSRESLSRVFMDQPKGERSWCHAISGIGRHFGLADSWAGWLAGYVAEIASISCATVKEPIRTINEAKQTAQTAGKSEQRLVLVLHLGRVFWPNHRG